MLDELRLVLAPAQAPPRHELHAGLDDEHLAEPVADRIGKLDAGCNASPDGGACFTPAACGLTRI